MMFIGIDLSISIIYLNGGIEGVFIKHQNKRPWIITTPVNIIIVIVIGGLHVEALRSNMHRRVTIFMTQGQIHLSDYIKDYIHFIHQGFIYRVQLVYPSPYV